MLFSFQFLKSSMIFLFICLLSGKNAFISFICPSPIKANQILHLLKPTPASLDKAKAHSSWPLPSSVTAQLLTENISYETLENCHMSRAAISWDRVDTCPSYHNRTEIERSASFCLSVGTGRYSQPPLPLSLYWLETLTPRAGENLAQEAHLCERHMRIKLQMATRNVNETSGFFIVLHSLKQEMFPFLGLT